ncbi:putative mitochondrial-processing peptidase subunit beta [Schizosaccharomyces pombe]
MLRLQNLPKLVRRFATTALPKTETTTLQNGLTVATEHHPYAQTATVLVGVDAGSRAETAKNNGAAHFLEHLAFKGTKNRSQKALELEFENTGAHLNAYTSREQTVYYAHAFKNAVPNAVAVLADILTNSSISASAVERERQVILREQEEVDKMADEVVFDHLHATAYQGHPLGRTILGPKENIESLTREDLLQYIKDNYRSDRMIITSAGSISHEELVKLAEKYFGHLEPSAEQLSLGAPRGLKPRFVGSEIRARDDDSPTANIAIAVEGMSWKHPDYFTALVMQAIIGNWDRAMGASPHLSSRLSTIVQQHQLANSFMSFSTSYSDTGLWGIYLVTENLGRIDDLVHFTLQNWARLTVATRAEVERAKAQLRASLLLSLDSTTAIAEDIGRQLLTTGRRMSPQEVDLRIGQITEKDVARVASEMIWDKDIAVSAVGSIEGLLDYNRIRSSISMNRW